MDPIWLVIVLIASSVVLALFINFSWVHDLHDSDSVVLTLISLDYYTPYYWGDNRYGMLVPWLARWVTDYRWNLLFQTQVLTLAAVLLPVLFNVFFLHQKRGLTVHNLSSAAIATALFFFLLRPTPRVAQVYLLSHPYHLSFLLLLIAVVFFLRAPRVRSAVRYLGAAAALSTSFYVNSSNMPLALGMLALLPADGITFRESLRKRFIAIVITLIAFAAFQFMASQYPALEVIRIAPPAEWPNTIAHMWSNLFAHFLHRGRVSAIIVIALAIAGLTWTSAVARKLLEYGDGIVFIGIAIPFALAISTSDYMARNLYEARYWTVSQTLILLVVTSWLGSQISQGIATAKGQAVAGVGSSVFLIVSGLYVFGIPSITRTYARLDRVSGVVYSSVHELRCTHMLGGYLYGWLTVYHSRLNNLQPRLWAITSRSEVTQHIWQPKPFDEPRYCGMCGDKWNEIFARHFQLGPLKQEGLRDGVCSFKPDR